MNITGFTLATVFDLNPITQLHLYRTLRKRWKARFCCCGYNPTRWKVFLTNVSAGKQIDCKSKLHQNWRLLVKAKCTDFRRIFNSDFTLAYVQSIRYPLDRKTLVYTSFVPRGINITSFLAITETKTHFILMGFCEFFAPRILTNWKDFVRHMKVVFLFTSKRWATAKGKSEKAGSAHGFLVYPLPAAHAL